jgi:hypothetical protein
MIIFLVTSCTLKASVSSSFNDEQKSKASYSSNSSEYSLNKALKAQINITSLQDLNDKSKAMGSTPGRVALALIINKLDDALIVEDLSKKTSQELFDILCQVAPQKSQTLEGLDQLYGLNNILASDGIYVNFQANNVVSAVSQDSSYTWADKFIKAINNTNSD